MKIVVLFNLQADADVAAYENWARTTDLPTVRGLDSIGGFEVFRTTGVMGTEDPAPYRYIEIIDVTDMDRFGSEVATDTMQKVAGEFQAFADNPLFIMTESIE